MFFLFAPFCFHRSRGKKHSVVLRTQLTVRVHACIGECQLTALIAANRFTLEPSRLGTHRAALCLPPCTARNHTDTQFRLCAAITAYVPCFATQFYSSFSFFFCHSCDSRACPQCDGAAVAVEGGRNTESWGQRRESASLMNGKKTGTNSSRCSSSLYLEAAPDKHCFFFSFLARPGVYIWMKDKSLITLDEFHSNAAQIFLACRWDVYRKSDCCWLSS